MCPAVKWLDFNNMLEIRRRLIPRGGFKSFVSILDDCGIL